MKNSSPKLPPRDSFNRRDVLRRGIALSGASWVIAQPVKGFQSGIGGIIRVYSDVPDAKRLPIRATRDVLMQYLARHTALPTSSRDLDVHLFASHSRYLGFVKQYISSRAPRRSTFIQTSDRHRIAIHVTDSAQQDLQHELCHALLHSTYRVLNLPLWADEGLAECCEILKVTIAADGIVRVKYSPSTLMHPEYRKHVHLMVSGRRLPESCNLTALERHRNSLGMTWHDYALSWAWTHFCVHGPEWVQREFKDYLGNLRSSSVNAKLASRLHGKNPAVLSQFRQFFM